MFARLAALAAVFSLLLSAAETKLLRHPSYHNGKVAFSYLGDIWVANDNGSGVQRLTVHRARDIYPRFSPDGQWIAFSSNRHGNYDVFVMPAAGGQARQLTFHSAPDTVVGWSPDSKRVVFQSLRGTMYPGIPNLYEVPADGGVETQVPTDWGYWGSYSPDGRRFAFNRHPMVWSRKHYRGSYAADLWIMDVASKSYTHLGDGEYKGNYFWPMYSTKGDIYFVADILANEKSIKPGSREVLRSANNIWKIGEKGGKPVQITKHTDGNLYFPSISADGRTIVYEENFGLWKLDTATGRASEIPIHIASDDKDNNIETVTVQGEAESFSLSPSTKRAAIAARGEIFTIATDRGEVLRVTETPWREQDPAWSPDGKWIAFVSDRSGREEVWIADERGGGLKKLSDANTDKQGLRWAPDSKSLLYSATDKKLYRADIDSGKTDVVTSGEAGQIMNAQFSPDGAWISYTKTDRTLRPHVYIIPAGGGQERAIRGYDTFSETGARWTPDGKKILFLAGLAQGGSATIRQTVMSLYTLSLVRDEKNPADRSIDSEQQAASADQTPRGRTGGGMRPPESGEAARKVEVKIEWDGLERRARRLTRLADNVVSVATSPDSRIYAFVTMGEQDGRFVSALYTIQEDGERLTRVAQAAPPPLDSEAPPERGFGFGGGISMQQFSRDGRTIFYRDANRIYSVDVPGGGGTGASPTPAAAASIFSRGRGASEAGGGGGEARRQVSFSIRLEVDHRAERKQVFAESWRVMRNRFYDPEMHGADWDKAKTVYEPLMEFVGDQEEMHNVVNQMIGELNASHTGISAFSPDRSAAQTRYPGFEMEPDASGFYKVSYIYKEGPADHDYTKVHRGDFVLEINGKPLKSGENYWKHYNSLLGRNMEFTMNSKPSMDGAWKVKIEPVSGQQFATLQYEKWVAERKALVDKLSGGEIGYLHIRQMNGEALRRFERELVENTLKKALIIDQRFNPGGGIDQELLEILQQRQYQKTKSRDSVEITRPQRAFFGPMVVMQNERSTSDAEVFPDGFRTLGLGKVVGVTTYGAVIGTGAHRLMDGSSIRTPGTGLWNVKGYNLENYGVPPDILVDNTPSDWLKGRDAQVERAVEVLKAELAGKK